MKKIFIVLSACLLLFGVAAQAKASYWAPGDLIRVVYQTNSALGTFEYATDLGSVTSIISKPSLLTNNAITVNLTGQSLAPVDMSFKVGYFAIDTTNNLFWTSGNADGKESNASHSAWGATYKTNAAGILTNYSNASAGSNNATFQMSGGVDGNSYYNRMEKNGAALGSFGQYLSTYLGDATLVTSGSAQQAIYSWNTNSKTPSTYQTNVGPVLNFQTNFTTQATQGAPIYGSDGKTVIAYNYTYKNTVATGSPVPIPPSALLFGSGLLGMIGIGRKRFLNS